MRWHRARAEVLFALVISILLSFSVCGCGNEITVSTITGRELNAVSSRVPDVTSFVSRTDGWGVTNENVYSNGIGTPIYHFHKGRWHPIQLSGGVLLRAVSTVGKDNVYAAGTVGASLAKNTGIIVNFDGKKWKMSSIKLDEDSVLGIIGISMVSPSAGWAVSLYGALYRYDGEKWSLVDKLHRSVMINGITAVSKEECWLIGDGIYQFKRGKWGKSFTAPNEGGYSMSLVNTTDSWVVGGDGTILHYDGNAWIEQKSPTKELLRSIDMLASDSGWIVGMQGSVLRYDGTNWQKVAFYPGLKLESVSGISKNEAWVSGSFEEKAGNTAFLVKVE
jgi:hypothetical protein